ncbi:glycosyltransferase family 2 protein [Cellulomonas triticagri]|uniref:Glycosyltransferase n=1 Tax=Cellulomonas triticagri TaxID=2483352 RepID=A0A3M2IYX1_9CELL|nr:glycosyltransferase family 2 protein [Cellulomonas triticagri]RMI07117.1 glycosyltransferase [Cellulomonas triticagri]
MTTDQVEVSVVLCTRDGAARLPETLAHLRTALDATARTAELVVVDNGSRDGTPALLAEAARTDPRVRVVEEACPGTSRARNRGVGAAAGDVLLFTDDDVHVPADWVDRMAGPLAEGSADLVGGAVALAPHLHRDWLSPELASEYFAVVPEPPVVGREFAAASIGATRAVLDQVPFDEALGTARYPGAEDLVFRLDALNAGFRQTAVAGATVEHHPDARRLEPARLAALATGRGRAEAYLAHHLHGRSPHAATSLAKLAVTSGMLLVRRAPAPRAAGAVDAEALRLRRRVAFHREMLTLTRTRPPR